MLEAHEKRLPPDRLSDLAVQGLQPRSRPYKVADGYGLYVLVNPDGGKLWRLNYYRPGAKTRNTLSLGLFPAVTLEQARRLRDEARALLAEGIDPGIHRKHAKAVDSANRRAPFTIDSDGTLTVNLPGRRFRLPREDADRLRAFLDATRTVGDTPCP